MIRSDEVCIGAFLSLQETTVRTERGALEGYRRPPLLAQRRAALADVLSPPRRGGLRFQGCDESTVVAVHGATFAICVAAAHRSTVHGATFAICVAAAHRSTVHGATFAICVAATPRCHITCPLQLVPRGVPCASVTVLSSFPTRWRAPAGDLWPVAPERRGAVGAGGHQADAVLGRA